LLLIYDDFRSGVSTDNLINFLYQFSFMTTGDDEKKFSVLPASTTGSLSSITTTSLVSERDLGDTNGSVKGDGDDQPDKTPKSYTTEKTWQTILQVAIPFFIAGLGTIGAGIILGRVEVCIIYVGQCCHRSL
jgi:hypothetical protein